MLGVDARLEVGHAIFGHLNNGLLYGGPRNAYLRLISVLGLVLTA